MPLLQILKREMEKTLKDDHIVGTTTRGRAHNGETKTAIQVVRFV